MKNNLTDKELGNVIQGLYRSFLEGQPEAPESLRDAEKEMQEAFERYLTEYERYTFDYAYRSGYKAGKGGSHDSENRI